MDYPNGLAPNLKFPLIFSKTNCSYQRSGFNLNLNPNPNRLSTINRDHWLPYILSVIDYPNGLASNQQFQLIFPVTNCSNQRSVSNLNPNPNLNAIIWIERGLLMRILIWRRIGFRLWIHWFIPFIKIFLQSLIFSSPLSRIPLLPLPSPDCECTIIGITFLFDPSNWLSIILRIQYNSLKI